MKIFIFGSHGMLGRYVAMHLKKYYEIVEINHNEFDASQITELDLRSLLLNKNISINDVVINCAGVTRHLADKTGALKTIIVNSIFPRLLADIVENVGAKLIHPTTDWVFDGRRGNYNEQDEHNAYDTYGRTKSLGEPLNCTVIRVAIIGEEVNQGRSLVEWVKRNHNKEIPGYTNHIWNGVTCYQFAKICKEIIDKNIFWNGVRHIFSNTITKFELVELINAIYMLHVSVKPKEAIVASNRTLASIYDPLFNIPTIGAQIAELREVEYELYGTTLAE